MLVRMAPSQIILLLVWVLLLLASLPVVRTDTKLRVAFIYINSPDDFSWSFKHDEARVTIDNASPDVKTLAVSRVSPDKFYEVALSLIDDRGVSLIFATSPEYQDTALALGEIRPDVNFVVVFGTKTSKNVAVILSKIAGVYVIGGMIAGRISKTGHAAFITGRDDSASRRTAQGFLIGAKMTNPNFKLYYVNNLGWQSSVRTQKEIQILKRDYGCDVFTGIDYDYLIAKTAASLGAYSFSFPTDFPRVVFGDLVYSGCDLEWSQIHMVFINMSLSKSWIPNYTHFGKVLGVPAPYSSEVPEDLIPMLNQWNQKIQDGYCMLNNETIGEAYPPSTFDSNNCLKENLRNSFMNFTSGVEVLGYFADEEILVEVTTSFSSPFSIAIMTVVAFIDVALLVGISVVWKFRKTLLVMTANQFFCYAILFGSALGFSDLFFWLGRPSDAICSGRIWFLCLGFSFIFGALAGKTFKMWRIWTHPEIKESRSSNILLLICVSILFFIQILFLSILTALSGYTTERSFGSTELNYDEYYLDCTLNKTGQILIGLILAFDGVIILICAVLAYLSRNVAQKFNEVPSVIISIYSILVSCSVVVILFLVMKENSPTKRAIIMTCGVFLGITFPLVSMFGPKFWKLWKEISTSSKSSFTAKNESNISSTLGIKFPSR